METNIYGKLIEIQKDLKAPKLQKNTFGGYNYRSCEDILEAVKPLCYAHGAVLLLTDQIIQVGDRYYVEATASLVDAENPSSVVCVSASAREPNEKKGSDPSQITGSASSYARKYALNGLFDIDDTKDADATNDHGKAPVKSAASPKPTVNALICDDCGGEIRAITDANGRTYTPQAIQKSSLKQYGRSLCYACAQKAKGGMTHAE